MNDDIIRQADVIAAALSVRAGSFADDVARFEATWQALLAAVARTAPRYAFEREGRPDAIAAVRRALPVMERDLLDAIVEDHACELAAVQEALYQVALAVNRGEKPASPPPA